MVLAVIITCTESLAHLSQRVHIGLQHLNWTPTVHPRYTATIWSKLCFGDRWGWRYIEADITYKLHGLRKFGFFNLIATEGGRLKGLGVRVIVFNATFNNMSVLLVEEIAVPGQNHWPAASHSQTLSHKAD